MAAIWQYRGNGDASQTFPKPVLEAVGGSPLLARLLANRGVDTPEAIEAYLHLDRYIPTSAWELPDAEAAVERIAKAVDAQESILVYGDFDVDGITGTSVLYETLKKHLKAKVSYYIPDRATEGHGLNTAALIRLTSSRSVKLVITTDTGITNFSEVSLLNGLGIDTVITDHHALPENLPPAIANVNPQRLLEKNPQHPLGPMCGAGVAYKLCELLLEKFMDADEARRAADSLLDIVAVGTVVDMVPLKLENRYLVYRGLQVLNLRQRPGFVEILEQASVNADAPITSETLGFTIGPRLNALGRLERADQGVELITSTDPERIRVIAAHLEFLNKKRRELCDQTYLEAESHLQRMGGLDDKRAIILGSADWNPGIIGIVASRLIERYHVPVFMMVLDEAKGEVRCSARSIPGFNLHQELLALEAYFLGFGGHAGAGGFALKKERLEAFKRDLYALCARVISDEHMKPVLAVDAKLEWSQLNPHLIEIMDRLSPCGMENPSPKFVVENLQIAAQRGIGDGERHLKLVLTPAGKGNGQPLDALIWNFGAEERFDTRESYSFAFVPSLNTFNGTTKVQMIVDDYQRVGAKSLTIEDTRTELPGTATRLPARPAMSATAKTDAPVLQTDSIVKTAAGLPSGIGMQWVDHRSRESVESFIGQLMQPLDGKRDTLVYHEGRKPDIPFLDEKRLCGRLALRKADELILWDLPPSLVQLQAVLDAVRPEVVHLVGGKYQSVPLFQPENNYLKLIMQLLRREAADQKPQSEETTGQPMAMTLSSLTARLATTEPVVSHGLLLLEKIGFASLKAESIENDLTLLVTLSAQMTSTLDYTTSLEYCLFQKALREVGQFRGWLLKSPLDTIKQALQSPVIRPTLVATAVS